MPTITRQQQIATLQHEAGTEEEKSSSTLANSPAADFPIRCHGNCRTFTASKKSVWKALAKSYQKASTKFAVFMLPGTGPPWEAFKNSTSNLSPRETSINGEAIWCSDTFCCVKHVFQHKVSGYGCWVLCITCPRNLMFAYNIRLGHHNCASKDSTNRPGHIETVASIAWNRELQKVYRLMFSGHRKIFWKRNLNMLISTLFFFLRYEFNEPFSLTPHLWGWMSGSRVQNLFEVSDTNTKFEHVPTWETNVKTKKETEIDKHSFAIAFSETVKIAANFGIAHIGRKAHTPYSSLHYLSGNGNFQSNVRFCRDLWKNTTYPFSSELEHVW